MVGFGFWNSKVSSFNGGSVLIEVSVTGFGKPNPVLGDILPGEPGLGAGDSPNLLVLGDGKMFEAGLGFAGDPNDFISFAPTDFILLGDAALSTESPMLFGSPIEVSPTDLDPTLLVLPMDRVAGDLIPTDLSNRLPTDGDVIGIFSFFPVIPSMSDSVGGLETNDLDVAPPPIPVTALAP